MNRDLVFESSRENGQPALKLYTVNHGCRFSYFEESHYIWLYIEINNDATK